MIPDRVVARQTKLEIELARRAESEVVAHIEAAAEVIRERWKLGILYLLVDGERRYHALMRQLLGITPKMLGDQLRDLIRDGLVSRTEHHGGAKHVEYALTPLGERLTPAILAFATWAEVYGAHRLACAEAALVDREASRRISPSGSGHDHAVARGRPSA